MQKIAIAFMLCASCSRSPSVSEIKTVPPPASGSKIKHLVIIEQENHTFDSYFGRYCQGTTSLPNGAGRAGCEMAPAVVPAATGDCRPDAEPLTDAINGAHDPAHNAQSEMTAMNRQDNVFKMDKYTCDSIRYAQVVDDSWQAAAYPAASSTEYPLRTYHNLAYNGALADRYFQPLVGASCSNDMFLARAGYMFYDNKVMPMLVTSHGRAYTDDSVGDLMERAGVSWAVYMEGFTRWQQGDRTNYPFGFDAADNAFAFFDRSQARIQDISQLATDLDADNLPAVALIRPLGIKTEHPGYGSKITDGEDFVRDVLQKLQASSAANDTLILLTWDEGGGFYDHVTPPMTMGDGTTLPRTVLAGQGAGDQSHILAADGTTVTLPRTVDDPEYYAPGDGQEYYGTRIPLLALGPFAKKNFISHVEMEHSSIVRFIEWNWLNNARLGTRDEHVNNIGDMLDPAQTGIAIPKT